MSLATRKTLRLAVSALVTGFVALSATSASASTILLSENFDSVAGLPGAGWAIVNNSSPIGTTDWFQGNPAVFPSQAGAANSYVGSNFEAAALGGNISVWLISPVLTLNDGDIISFYTQAVGAGFPDRLELRLSASGASTDVGATDVSVGDFTGLLTTINPTLDPSGYPSAWTQINQVVSGLGGPTSGRFAFRSFVPDTNVNGNYLGIDTLVVTSDPVPEPATLTLLSVGLLAAARARRRSSRR